MKILAIDTATDVCSVAILENNDIIKEKTLEAVNTHSVALMPLIQDILKECNLSLNDIDLFACDKGPGSFTGIRIGLSTIKAFCDVTNKPCVGITSLEGFAYKLKNILSSDYYICSLLNANHNNAYCGIFKFDNTQLTQFHDYFSDSIVEILKIVNQLEKNIFFVGNCGILYKDMIQSGCVKNFEIDNNINISAVDIGRAAFDKFSFGTYGDSDYLTPLYLKKSSAELSLKNKSVY